MSNQNDDNDPVKLISDALVSLSPARLAPQLGLLY